MWQQGFLAAGLILAIGAIWISIQFAYRRFAERHPEFGPAQEVLGCGLACTCSEPCEEQRMKMKKQRVEEKMP